ncbi:hypothetical protein AO1008_04079 [Aspergillus oryzae 100-8]|uniref:Uncharacterized protein n=1 Tax=Aspergillus oryzae (strain 3.042) TaxID=1160506 RepID=I8TKB9_ASPO3|nr:hypothetical protein Ao3042_09671 [Aspergillus oryzae 3.042]KDE77862.1 hypothetical protein AO1008_04079 [Aspergillus oryzae 100-8]|eukprot:EIT74485.1 hypothetical protein Ao3042_09671 [Aspergillus oryzae 3.042]
MLPNFPRPKRPFPWLVPFCRFSASAHTQTEPLFDRATWMVEYYFCIFFLLVTITVSISITTSTVTIIITMSRRNCKKKRTKSPINSDQNGKTQSGTSI